MSRLKTNNKRKEVMLKAWEMFRYGSKPFRVCLVESWAKINKRTSQEFEEMDFGML